MKENSQDVLTVSVFDKLLEARLDERFDRFDQKMMSGFEAVFNRFEKLENKIDNLLITKADREDVLLLNKRLTKLEEKIA